MSYIAYLDVIATSAAASERNFYQVKIGEFVSNLVNYSVLLGEESSLHYFSDCAYIQTRELSNLIEFLTSLRDVLMHQRIYFTAAVIQGELNPSSSKSKEDRICKIQGSSFFGNDIAKLYSFHSKFKGIGIALHKEIVEDPQNKKLLERRTVESYYIPEVGSKEKKEVVNDYLDVAFSSIIEDDVYRRMIRSILEEAMLAGCQEPRYGRNYIPLLVTLMKSPMQTNIEWNQNSETFKNIPYIWNLVFKLSLEPNNAPDLFGLKYLSLVLIDLLYTNTPSNRLLEYQRKKLSGQLLRKGVLFEKYGSISEIDKCFFCENNLKRIYRDYQETATDGILNLI
jgi:hypothetical protein